MPIGKFLWTWVTPLVFVGIWTFAILKLIDPFLILVAFDSGVAVGGVSALCWWYNKQPKRPPPKDSWYVNKLKDAWYINS